MKKRVLCVIGDQFEEIETVAPIDLLRRAGAEVTIASATDSLTVTGRSNIKLIAELLLEQLSNPKEFDCLLLPGGPGVKKLRTDTRIVNLAKLFYSEGKVVAAICAAPLILFDAGILAGKRYTAHFSVKEELQDALTSESVVEDGNVVTVNGAGASIQFGLRLVRKLYGNAVEAEIRQAIMF